MHCYLTLSGVSVVLLHARHLTALERARQWRVWASVLPALRLQASGTRLSMQAQGRQQPPKDAPLPLPGEAPGAARGRACGQQEHQQRRPQVAQRAAADVAHHQAREAGRLHEPHMRQSNVREAAYA